MKIFGIDPGIAIMGWGLVKVRKGTLLYLCHGSITTPKNKGAGERLWILEKGLKRLLAKYKPNLLVVESLYFFRNLKTAMPVSQARGVILLAAAKKNLPVLELTPLQAKMAITGYGRAEKKQVQLMVQQILRLKKLPKPDDAADALALAIAGSALTPTLIKQRASRKRGMATA